MKDWTGVMQCDCGSETFTVSTKSIGNMQQSCGKCKRKRREPLPDQTGKRVGSLLVIAVDPTQKTESGKHAIYKCQCDCGNAIDIAAHRLHYELNTHCGCQDKISPTQKMEHKYEDMLDRCYNPQNTNFRIYGGKGIRVCKRWRLSFDNFLADMGFPPPGIGKNKYTLDRIDVNKDYSPENCRWSTVKEQNNNKTNNHYITVNGKRHTVSRWAEITGVNIARRLAEGWDEVLAVTTPEGFSRVGATISYEEFF